MANIHVLPARLCDMIAAGEVVDRPASAVKELMENSIDAGARSVTVEIQGSGSRYIRVTDDGCGMDGDDLRTAFLNHATSKITTDDDLWNISTLGFRGEALPSIAAVAKVEARARTAGGDGAYIKIEGGVIVEEGPAACPAGFDIVVRELFYNTPGRQKFLKKDATEASAVAAVIDRTALASPGVAVRFVRDGRETFRTPGDGDPMSAVYAVLGRDAATAMLGVDYELGGVRVTGCISRPERSRVNRSAQYFFVNGRYVRSRAMSFTLENACKSYIPQGRHAAAALYITADPRMIDANVHPQKLEVKFADERRVTEALHFAVKSAVTQTPADRLNPRQKPLLEELDSRPAAGADGEQSLPEFSSPSGFGFTPDADKAEAAPRTPADSVYVTRAGMSPGGIAYTAAPEREAELGSPRLGGYSAAVAFDEAAEAPQEPAAIAYEGVREPPPSPEPEPEQMAIPGTQGRGYRLAGECYSTYAVVETREGVLFVDKHAARERIIYERLKAADGPRDSQALLRGAVVRLSRDEHDAVTQNMELLARAGFMVEDFGGGSLMVRGVPMDIACLSPEDAITGVAAALAEGKRDAKPEIYDRLLYSLACKAAIKAGKDSAEGDLAHLIDELMSMPEVKYCPHGRPVSFLLPKSEIDRRLGR